MNKKINISKGFEPIVLAVGESFLEVPGGTIWYNVSGTGKGTPVVLLHGGPGGDSSYLNSFESLGNDRQVIRYDQSGSGKSGSITDSSMFTIEHFTTELDLLRDHLGLSEWHVSGHSWGTIVAVEYYRAYPERVTSLTLGSPCLDISAWERSTRYLLTTFPETVQQAVQDAEATGDYYSPHYEHAMNLFNEKYVWGPNPVQPDFDNLIKNFNQNMYVYMWGMNEFTVTGTLKNYNATPFLSQIKVPTLFTVGEFDEILPEIVREFARKVPNSKFVAFAGSCHMTAWYARDENVKVVRDFLNSVDSES